MQLVKVCGGGPVIFMRTAYIYMVSLCLASICLLLCPALRVFAHLTWLVAWLPCLPCRIWCKIIIITAVCGALHDLPGMIGLFRLWAEVGFDHVFLCIP
jgi:hypothetical protein